MIPYTSSVSNKNKKLKNKKKICLYLRGQLNIFTQVNNYNIVVIVMCHIIGILQKGVSHNLGLFSCFRIFKTDPTHNKCSTGTFNGVKHDYLVLNMGFALGTLELSKFVRSL